MKSVKIWVVALIASLFLSVSAVNAQSITSGDVTGTVTDPSGAVLPNAAVTLKNDNTGTTQNAPTNGAGQYRFSLLQPGTYTVNVTAPGFQPAERKGIAVIAGQAATANLQLGVATSTTTVQVTESASAIQSENADYSTTYNAQTVLNMPNPGGDITYIAQTAPGVTMNTQSGYGNFSAEGMPGTSNLFMLNGQNFNDPFLGLNNSGASNLLLGFNDIGEAVVINNAYSAQYGQYAGTQVSYTTKSGANSFHGDAVYFWDGRATNANNFFLNQAGEGTPFLNFNQWATDVNGPIIKNKTFFDVDYEGVRVALPTNSVLVKVASPQFQSATLANLAANGNSAEIPFYQQLFKLENGAAGIGSAVPVSSDGAGGCGDFSSNPAFGAGGLPCALQFRTTPPAAEREYQWSARVDHNFSDKDHAFLRLYRDDGFQPTYTDYLNSAFNAHSLQPQESGQFNETHTFNATTVNQFNGSVLYYSAPFALADEAAALSALPSAIDPVGHFFSTIGGEDYDFPQGRRVFQYQVIDDLSKVAGNHTFRMGFSWLHDTVTDLGFGVLTIPLVRPGTLDEFYNGGGPDSYIEQNFPTASEEPFSFNTFGGYVSDDWKVNERLTVSLNLRLENYANPTCATDCFSRLASDFNGSVASANTPYNQTILSGQHNAFANTQAIVWEPRVGIAWRPTNSDKTVLRAGAGVFADEFPGTFAESAAENLPNENTFVIYGNELASGTGTYAPTGPNSLTSAAVLANQALRSGFANGGTLNSITAAVPGFSPPSFTNFPSMFKQPTYYKWNFEIQRGIGSKSLLSVNYAGMHGEHIPIADNGLNAYCPPSNCPNGFIGLPSSAPDPRFSTVTQYFAGGIANYDGLIVSFQRRLANSVTLNANYTWSHALDDVSNEGAEPFNYGTDESLLYPQNPFNFRSNYGASDYDVRHYFSAGFVVNDLLRSAGFHSGPARIFGGWTLAGNIFYRSGLPYTVVDSGTTAVLDNYGAQVFASPVGAVNPTCNISSVLPVSGAGSPCLNSSGFLAAGTQYSFGSAGRNSFYGPHFFDMDLSVMKDIAITEHVTFSFGAQAFNALNHPNFDQPVNDINNSTFGYIINPVGTPTSILGSFVGGNNSPRFIEIRGQIRF